MKELDRRLHAYRPDLADAALKATVRAARYITGTPAQITRPVVDLRDAPRPEAEAVSQALLGETVSVFEEAEAARLRSKYFGCVPGRPGW